VKKEIQFAHAGPHFCLQRVIFESCYVGSPIKRPMWEGAIGVKGDALDAPKGDTTGEVILVLFFQEGLRRRAGSPMLPEGSDGHNCTRLSEFHAPIVKSARKFVCRWVQAGCSPNCLPCPDLCKKRR